MRVTIIFTAAALLAANAAHAEPGMAFLKRCHGYAAPVFCGAYEHGYFDALAASGVICPAPTVALPQVMLMTERWMHDHINHLNAPVRLILRTAMLNAWPCR